MESSGLIGQAQSSWLIFGVPSQPQLTQLKLPNMIQANKRLIGTQNTSRKMLTRRKKITWQFLIGTEMRLFGVLCRPERSRGIAMRNWRAVASDKQGPGAPQPRANRALARRSLSRRRLIEFLWEIRTPCNPHKTRPRSHF